MRPRGSIPYIIVLTIAAVASGLPAPAEQPTVSSRPASHAGGDAGLPPPGDPVNLVLDDGIFEANIGLQEMGGSVQFEWLNRFSPAELPIEVSRIDIWWDSLNSGAVGGESIELVLYDGGADPCTGVTTIIWSELQTISSLDTFDQYRLNNMDYWNYGPSVYLAVIDRWVISGAGLVIFPATLDTSATQARSFLASWSADPPSPPELPPDGLCGLIDSFGLPGNWLIRGAGTVVPVELMQLSVE